MNTQKRILIADDDQIFIKLITNEFKLKGFEVFSVSNGQDVIDKVLEIKPDVILMDMIMPIKNGFDAIKEIRMNKSFDGMKIIALSNLSQEEDINKATKLGANAYLFKRDYSLKDLIDKVLAISGN